MQTASRIVSKRLTAFRNAMTMIEVLVCIGIIGFLSALILPAVVQSREAARAVECKNNLHEIGIATHSYCEAYGHLPESISPLQKLLPEIGMAALAKTYASYQNLSPSKVTGPSLYVCPSDPDALTSGRMGPRISYLLNDGSALWRRNGLLTHDFTGFTRLNQIVDGLSTTALFAEHLSQDQRIFFGVPVSDEEARREPLRHTWRTTQNFVPGQELQLAAYCLNVANRSTASLGGVLCCDTLNSAEIPYNHMIPPNNWAFAVLGDPMTGAFPPSSQHPHGVHIMMMDGHVKFVTNSIDLHLWRSIGSRNGGEHVGAF